MLARATASVRCASSSSVSPSPPFLSFSKFNTNEVTEKAQRTNIDYLAIGFPYGKFGFTFGIS
jgi:hypothetical protein